MNLLVSAVEKFAPGIATALLGPMGGVATSLLESAFGVKADALPAAISSDPDAAIKLKELEYKHGESLANINATNYATQVSDVKNARTFADNWIVHALAILWTTGFFLYVTLGEIKIIEFDKGVFHDLLNASFLILSFYFGSSYKQVK